MLKWHLLIILGIAILLLLPLVLQDGGYIKEAFDFQNDIARAEQAKADGDVHDMWNQYFGRTMTAYMVGKTSLVTGISCKPLQLVFDYAVLLLAGITIYGIATYLFGISAGILSSLAVLFCTHSILGLFSSGDVWDIAETCIILPIGLLFIVKWLTEKGQRNLIAGLVVLAVFSMVHPLSLMLSAAMVLFIGTLVIYKHTKAKKLLLLLSGIVAGNLILAYLFINNALVLPLSLLGIAQTKSPLITYATTEPVSIVTFLYEYLSLPTLGIGVIAYIAIAKTKLQEKQWLFLLALGCFIVPLLTAAMTGLAIDTRRHAMDAATLLALGIGCLAGFGIKEQLAITGSKAKTRVLAPVTAMVVAIGMIPTLAVWIGGSQ